MLQVLFKFIPWGMNLLPRKHSANDSKSLPCFFHVPGVCVCTKPVLQSAACSFHPCYIYKEIDYSLTKNYIELSGRKFFWFSSFLSPPIFFPFAHLHPASDPSPGFHCTILCVRELCIYVLWLISSSSFTQQPSTLTSLRSISLFHVSMPLAPFCSSVYFLLDSTYK